MDRLEYGNWWARVDDEGLNRTLPEPERTLARHVLALQDRIDQLPSPDQHDRDHGAHCRCRLTQCACAYDHPDAVCMTHKEPAHPPPPVDDLQETYPGSGIHE